MAGIPTEASILQMVDKAMPGKLKNVYCASSGGGKYIAVLQFQKSIASDEGRHRQAALTGIQCIRGIKHVFLVDEDVDCFDMNDVLWAMTTRFQADRDLILYLAFNAIRLILPMILSIIHCLKNTAMHARPFLTAPFHLIRSSALKEQNFKM